ncbi:unnamed protein product [Lupinus luteus]|uniref:BHLH domain-containing protein n=1 Tax=Lupinus luteus TaxID=3873 RepID=A0AAV1YAF9_LUPLU
MEIVEFLRPLVHTKAWDFIVLWKYGNDPTRYIEWMDCCCSGSCSEENIEQNVMKLKEEEMDDDDDNQCNLASNLLCRDTHFHHPIRTKACEELAKLPFAFSLFSGVHGEIAISQQPKWLTQDQEGSAGTQVLIPIVGGLIELFTAKLIPKDMSIIEYISAHCCVSLKQETTTAVGYASLNFIDHLPGAKCSSHLSIEGTSSGSNPSNEHLSFDSKTRHEYLKQLVKISPMPKVKRPKYNDASGKQMKGLSSHCGTGDEDKAKLVRQPRSETFIAKNLATERKRRNKIKNGLFTLRSLVPKITKMDRVSILSDAIDYIKELQHEVKELKDEVMALEVEECERNKQQLKISNDKEHGGTRRAPLTELNQSSSECNKKRQMKVQVEVCHIGRTDFLIKLLCEKKQGGFSRLMEAVHSFGLQVASANVTTLDGKVMNILTVKATKQDIHPATLKEYLIKNASE